MAAVKVSRHGAPRGDQRHAFDHVRTRRGHRRVDAGPPGEQRVEGDGRHLAAPERGGRRMAIEATVVRGFGDEEPSLATRYGGGGAQGLDVHRHAVALERRIAGLLGFERAVSTSTATSAFWLLARALGLDGSTEVIVPNIHFYGVTNVLRLLGVPYRVADVGPGVPNITAEAMAACLTPRTRAVVALDYGGWLADVPGMRRALAAAGRSDVLLIADAANSLFTRVDGTYCARSYDHAFLSFDMNKIVVTGDGGMVLTDDATVSERVRRLAYHGLEREGVTGFERARRR